VNADEIGTLLAAAATFDRRITGEMDVIAWYKAIGDLDLPDAVEAVAHHYGHSTDWCQPAHVRAGVEAILADRRNTTRAEHEALEREQRQLALGSGPLTERSADVQQLVRDMSAKLSSPEASLERAKLRARSMKGRPDTSAGARRTPAPVRGRRPEYADPATSEVAELARNYLWDGYTPADVSERLYISRRWCERAAREPDPRPPELRADRPPVVRQPGDDTDGET